MDVILKLIFHGRPIAQGVNPGGAIPNTADHIIYAAYRVRIFGVMKRDAGPAGHVKRIAHRIEVFITDTALCCACEVIYGDLSISDSWPLQTMKWL